MKTNRILQGTVTLLFATAMVAGCSGGGYSNSNQTTPAPTAAFTSPSSTTAINLGQSVKLTWSSSGTDSCTASTSSASAGAFSGSVDINGSASVAPTATGSYVYTLNCASSYGGNASNNVTVTVNPNVLSTMSRIGTIGSTPDPVEQGGNPYGLAIAPITAGLMTAGDLVVCNFNDGATNTQGLGTTIVGLHPIAGATPYRIAQSAQLTGCNALALLADGSISASAYSSNLNPLVSPSGIVGNPFGSDAFANPWGQAYVAASGSQPAALYVSNAGNGSIDRITLNGDVQTSMTEIAKGFCASGAPGAVYAPSGLTYDPSIDTLYIVDTSSYSVVALANVSTIGTDGVIVDGACNTVAHTPTPLPSFTGASASSARVIANGGQLNAPISAALLADGDLVVGNGDIDNPTTTNLLFEISPAIGFVGTPMQLDTGAPGALFGIATTKDSNGNQLIYFNDDNTNTVNLLSK